MVHNILGCHGTSHDSGRSIIDSGFRLSIGFDEWLGDGAYFFINGVNNNIETLATKWAIAEAWDNELKQHKYEKYCVLESEINVDDENFLDLTTSDGVEVFEYFVETFLDKIKSIGRNVKYQDGLLINLARQENIFPIYVAKGNFYIKFSRERVNRIHLRINNCTICAVYNTDTCVKSTSVVKTGDVYETY